MGAEAGIYKYRNREWGNLCLNITCLRSMAKSIRSILIRRADFAVNGSLWIECNGTKFFGPGPAELLERIDQTGSINQAAKEMNMSYKKAWGMINMLNTWSAKPFVITQTGGSSGGGSIVTSEAKKMISWYRQLRKKNKTFLQRESRKLSL